MDIQGFFENAMAREIPPLIPLPPISLSVLGFDLGASGIKRMAGCIPLGLPDWRWPRDRIPAEDGTVDVVHAYHFLEHLSGEDAISLLREIERVIRPGAPINICVPYYNSSMQAHDLTHKSFWNEATFSNLFNNPMYDPAGPWKLKVHALFIMGIVERNMALLAQLVKEGE